MEPLIGLSETLSNRSSHNYTAKADSVTWGTNRKQAAVMQFGAQKGAFGLSDNGSSIPWGDIPARPFIGVGQEDIDTIVELAEDHLAPNE